MYMEQKHKKLPWVQGRGGRNKKWETVEMNSKQQMIRIQKTGGLRNNKRKNLLSKIYNIL